MKEMKKVLLSWICLAVLLNPCLLFAKEKPVRFSDIQPDLESAIGKLSTYINILEDIQNRLDASARANQK